MAHAEVLHQCGDNPAGEKSTPAAYEPVALRTSICPSWAFCSWPRHVPVAGSDDSLHFSARRRGVSSRGLSRQPCSLSFPLPEISCSRLIRSAEFCYAFLQCLRVASRVSISWYRSLLRAVAQVARAVLDQPCHQRVCVPRILRLNYLFPQRVTSFTLTT